MNPVQAIQLFAAWGNLKKAWANRGDDMGLTIGQVLKSKTAWTALIAGGLNAWQALSMDPNVHLSPQALTLANAGLALATILFRMMNSQKPTAKP